MNYKLNVRMEEDFKTRLQAKADEAGMTLSEVVRALLEAWLNDEIQITVSVTQPSTD